jgi:hypothetical protein
MVNNQISREALKLLAYKPNWMVRNAYFVFLTVLLLFISTTWWIELPSSVRGVLIVRPAGNAWYGLMTVSKRQRYILRIGQRVLIGKDDLTQEIGLTGRLVQIWDSAGSGDSILVKVDLQPAEGKDSVRTIVPKGKITATIVTGGTRLLYKIIERLKPYNFISSS